MSKYFYALVLTLGVVGMCAAQNVGPAPTPTPSDDVVRISTNLIQIDVSVTDSKGRPIRDLRPDEIEIYENGDKQKITNFSFISAPTAKGSKPLATGKSKSDVAPPPITGFELRPEQIRRTIALVVDDLLMSNFSIADVRKALRKFVDQQMQPGDLVAVIRVGAGIGALQQFTSDKSQLYRAIESIRWNIYQGRIGYFDAATEPEPEFEAMKQPDNAKGIRADDAGEKEVNAFKKEVFTIGTLGALSFVIRGMEELPGRKSVLLFSEGFGMHSEDPTFLPRMRSLLDSASRASVVINTADPRGVMYTGFSAVDAISGRNAALATSARSSRDMMAHRTRGGLVYLAEQTGGKFVKNNNDLSGAIREILDDQSYYLVGYEPDSDTFDPRAQRFNTLDVKVTRPGATVRHRSGFFAVRSRAPVERSGRGKLYSALSSPFSINDVTLRLNGLFENDATLGSRIRTLIHVDAADLTFTPLPNGSMQTRFDLITAAVGDNGVTADNVNKTYTVTATKETYARFLKNGFVYSVDLPIKKAGAYQLRAAIQDAVTGRVGSANQFLVMPDVKKGKLVLSGVYLENVSFDEWKSRAATAAADAQPGAAETLNDTSLRKFRRQTVLNYGFSVYNVKPVAEVTMQLKVYFGDKLVMDGTPRAIATAGTTGRLPAFGSLNLGEDMLLGDYVMQIIVRNGQAGKDTVATQFVPFQIVE